MCRSASSAEEWFAASPEELPAILARWKIPAMKYFKVSTRVNNTSAQGADLIEPLPDLF
ncbi:MAG: hypothetical protein AB2697_08440 [Candidatus Thiodiazotropha endolucinida]